MKSELLWGIDLGGTKIESVVLKRKSNEVLTRKRIPTEASKGYKHIIGQISKLIDLTSANIKQNPKIIGIGTPGSLDTQNSIIKNSNTVCLNDQPFKKDLEQTIKMPVIMANDANCFALAETNIGIVPDVCPDAEVVFGIIIGTGVGGGLIVNGKIINGRHGITGEWGHNFLDESGGPCYCGQTGCVEQLISGPSLETYHQNLSGKGVSLSKIFALNQTDKNATKTIKRLNKMFGKSVSQLINIIDPDVIVVGGGVGNIDTLYSEGREEIKEHLFNNELNTIIVKPKLGDSAGVFGAAMLV